MKQKKARKMAKRLLKKFNALHVIVADDVFYITTRECGNEPYGFKCCYKIARKLCTK